VALEEEKEAFSNIVLILMICLNVGLQCNDLTKHFCQRTLPVIEMLI